MENCLFHHLSSICNNLVNRRINKLYIFPFGKRGMEVYDFIKNRYASIKIDVIDEDLNKYNPDIMDFNYMKTNIISENAVVLLASDNPLIYRELRLLVAAAIPNEKIIDCFEENPLVQAEKPRVAALALASKQIYNNKVSGCVAEAGVYQGEFAKLINVLFPDRRLYLFDTFQGFKSNQVDDKIDNIAQTRQWINDLKDTTVDTVMKKMKYPNQVVIRQGTFPNTANDINEKFAFVSLDMDLYKPTYDGLLFFWERMCPGGYIFIHDFDNWDGIKKSVIRFCEEKRVMYVCLNDRISVCIAKPIK